MPLQPIANRDKPSYDKKQIDSTFRLYFRANTDRSLQKLIAKQIAVSKIYYINFVPAKPSKSDEAI